MLTAKVQSNLEKQRYDKFKENVAALGVATIDIVDIKEGCFPLTYL
jgi:hypothetical protein